jgi:glutamyl-Q tRNA(Asp) synthetase
MEDLDPPREMKGAKALILNALDRFELFSDEKIIFQSDQEDAYQTALSTLRHKKRIFYCRCSRKQMKAHPTYSGACREHLQPSEQPESTRFLVGQGQSQFSDIFQGDFCEDFSEFGDFVVYRKDNFWAYQLAVCVDDHLQGITHMIRGIDLIDSTPRQIALQQALEYSSIQYGHLPVIMNDQGQKLSKQNLAPALNLTDPLAQLAEVLGLLGIVGFDDSSAEKALNSSIKLWSRNVLINKKEILPKN